MEFEDTVNGNLVGEVLIETVTIDTLSISVVAVAMCSSWWDPLFVNFRWLITLFKLVTYYRDMWP